MFDKWHYFFWKQISLNIFTFVNVAVLQFIYLLNFNRKDSLIWMTVNHTFISPFSNIVSMLSVNVYVVTIEIDVVCAPQKRESARCTVDAATFVKMSGEACIHTHGWQLLGLNMGLNGNLCSFFPLYYIKYFIDHHQNCSWHLNEWVTCIYVL